MPYKITLSCTFSCNSRCRICGIWRIYKEKPELRKKELSLEEIELIFRNLGNSILWLSLTGGEPFMRNDIVEIVESATKNLKNLSLISINTNGLATDKIIADVEKILSRNPSKKFFVVVSLADGFKGEYNKIRGLPDAYERAEETLNGLLELKKKHRNMEVNIETIVTDYNKDKIKVPEWSEVEKRGYKTIFAFIDDSSYYRCNESIANEKKFEKTALINEFYRKSRVALFEDIILKIFYGLMQEYFKDRNSHVLPCYSSWSSFFIDPYGDVKPCMVIDSFGNLREYDLNLKELIKSSGSIKEVQKAIIDGKCPNCWTPCEAFQTIIQNFPNALIKCALKNV